MTFNPSELKPYYLYAVKCSSDFLDENGKSLVPFKPWDILAICTSDDIAHRMIQEQLDNFLKNLGEDYKYTVEHSTKDWHHKICIEVTPDQDDLWFGPGTQSTATAVIEIGCERFEANKLSEEFDGSKE